MAVEAVLVTESKLAVVVTKIPEVSVRVPEIDVGALRVTVLLPAEPELAIVRLFAGLFWVSPLPVTCVTDPL